MSSYYYLVSQLPFLIFGEATRINRGYLLEEAKKWLSERDFSFLLKADINNFSYDETLPQVLREYREFEFNLRTEISLFRPWGKEQDLLRKTYKADKEYAVGSFLKSITAQDNPLDIERKLLYLRWQFIEEKESGHYFDLEFVILYFLKLQILERLFMFNKEKGLAIFDKLCEVRV